MFKETEKFYSSSIDSEKLRVCEDNELIKVIQEKYKDLQICYIPDKYDVAFVLLEEDKNDSFNDKWKILFIKKVLSLPKGLDGNITLDDIENLKVGESSYQYEIYKEMDGSFEDVIKTSCDLISKHKHSLEETEA